MHSSTAVRITAGELLKQQKGLRIRSVYQSLTRRIIDFV